MGYTEKDARLVRQKAATVRKNIVEMLPAGKVGHLGGSSSIADVTAALYFKHMRVFADPKDPRRDRCVFSKGHAVLAQYACFAELGYIPRSEFAKLKTIDGILQGHPDYELTPGIEAVTGSLGQGLSISLGMALALKLDGSDSRVFCVIGDGEQDEGQIWEAAMAAAAKGADNLCVILDYNGIQATDATKNVLPVGDLKEKWEAFGWNALPIDGHDAAQILSALENADRTKGKPTVIIAKTVKGKGFSFAENTAAFHNGAMTEEQYAAAIAALDKAEKEAR